MASYRWTTPTQLNGTASAQALRGTAALSDGSLAVLWLDRSGPTEVLRLSMRDGAGGTARGADSEVTGYPSLEGATARIAALPGGGVVVAYEVETGRADLGSDIRLRFYDAAGEPVGPARSAASVAETDQKLVDLVALADGGFGLVWQDTAPRGRLGDIYDSHLHYRLFEADGTPRSAQATLASVDGTRTDPAPPFYLAGAAALADGGIAIRYETGPSAATVSLVDAAGVVTETDAVPNARYHHVHGLDGGGHLTIGENALRFFGTDGNPVSPSLSLGQETADWFNRLSDVVTLADGRIAYGAAYQNSPATGAYEVLLIEQHGLVETAALDVLRAQTGGRTFGTDIAALPDGRFVVTIGRREGLEPREIHLQILDPRTAGVQLNGSVGADQYGGTRYGDTIRGFLGDDLVWAHRGDDLIEGEAGDDRLLGQGGNDILRGGEGDDTLLGGTGDDRLSGDAGDDLLDGGAGADVLDGGAGDDVLTVNAAADMVIEAPDGGDDTVRSETTSLSLADYPNVENAMLAGPADLDLTGTAAANRLTGNFGANRLTGGSGRDTLDGSGNDDSLLGGAGRDVLLGSWGADTLFGGGGADALDGGPGDDNLSGQSGPDLLEGGAGHDLLQGGSGRDTLEGGAGDDALEGGGGADSFVFRVDGGSDTVLDHQPGRDAVLLDEALWGGGLTPAQVETDFGAVVAGDLVLDFGAGNSLTVQGVTALGDDLGFA